MRHTITETHSQKLETVAYPTAFNIKQEIYINGQEIREWIELDKDQAIMLKSDLDKWLRGQK